MFIKTNVYIKHPYEHKHVHIMYYMCKMLHIEKSWHQASFLCNSSSRIQVNALYIIS